MVRALRITMEPERVICTSCKRPAMVFHLLSKNNLQERVLIDARFVVAVWDRDGVVLRYCPGCTHHTDFRS